VILISNNYYAKYCLTHFVARQQISVGELFSVSVWQAVTFVECVSGRLCNMQFMSSASSQTTLPQWYIKFQQLLPGRNVAGSWATRSLTAAKRATQTSLSFLPPLCLSLVGSAVGPDHSNAGFSPDTPVSCANSNSSAVPRPVSLRM